MEPGTNSHAAQIDPAVAVSLTLLEASYLLLEISSAQADASASAAPSLRDLSPLGR